jgi:hypothetical protein
MKKAAVSLALCLLFSSVAYSNIQKDGFDVTILHSATKSFNAGDARLGAFSKYLKANFEQNSSGSSNAGDMLYEETVYLDKNGNSIKVVTEKNAKTGAGTTTVTITGPEDFVTSIRAMLK